LPDETVIARRLRERRIHGRRLPDQAVLARYIRERRGAGVGLDCGPVGGEVRHQVAGGDVSRADDDNRGRE
jgi:hypothetical protein